MLNNISKLYLVYSNMDCKSNEVLFPNSLSRTAAVSILFTSYYVSHAIFAGFTV